MLIEKNSKIGDVAKENFRTVEVFERYGLDFCCGGKKSIETACNEKNLNTDELINDLNKVQEGRANADLNFNEWDPAFLSEYIVNVHHTYVSSSVPRIFEHAKKVASVHGERHPETINIFELFSEVAEELSTHMAKEEQVLFPYIKNLSTLSRTNAPTNHPPFGTVNNPIKMMEQEHENAGAIFDKIRELSNNLTPPEDACNTFRVLYSELDEFEKDLHRHIHLENNILFPKAIELEKSISYN